MKCPSDVFTVVRFHGGRSSATCPSDVRNETATSVGSSGTGDTHPVRNYRSDSPDVDRSYRASAMDGQDEYETSSAIDRSRLTPCEMIHVVVYEQKKKKLFTRDARSGFSEVVGPRRAP